MMSARSTASPPLLNGAIWGVGTLAAEAILLSVAYVAIAQAGGSQRYDATSGGYLYDPSYPSEGAGSFLQIAIPLALLLALLIGLAGWFVTHWTLTTTRRSLAHVDHWNERHPGNTIAPAATRDEQRDLENVVAQLLERLETGFANGSRFAANASHELRTPLAASRTMMQVAMKTPKDDETTRVLTRLLQLNDRMIGITGALLDLAAAENEFAIADVELRAVVADTIALLEPEISERRVRLHLNLDDVTVRGHDALLRQLVTNLIRNAIVHNDVGGSLAVTLHGGTSTVFAIENDGSRIDLDDLTLLTQPFTRLEERTSRKSGSGLGLAIVSSIVDAHKAELIMTARPRGGLITQVVFAAANSTAPPPSSTTR